MAFGNGNVINYSFISFVKVMYLNWYLHCLIGWGG